MLETLLLVATVLMAFAIAVIFIFLIFGKGGEFDQRFKSIFILDERLGLAHQGLLWLSIAVPISLGFCLGMWAWWGYTVNLSSSGFKTFVEISIVPLAVMSLALPVAGLVSRFHSTKQAATQIEVVSLKNNLDAYYSHRKELIAYFDCMKSVVYLDVVKFKYPIHPVLHKRFFDGVPTEGTPEIIVESFESVERRILSAASALMFVFTSQDREVALNRYLQACTDIIQVSTWLGVRKIYIGLRNKGVFVYSGKNSVVNGNRIEGYATIGCTTAEILASIRFVRGFYDCLCDFSGFRRMEIEGHDLVFHGGEKLIQSEPIIESLHDNEIATAAAAGKAAYEKNHSRVRGDAK